jgi:exodeoxyribonuclease VII small subunit
MTAKTSKTSDEEPKSFEVALQRIEELVSQLEAGDVPLEESLKAFEEGQRLIKFCEKRLNAAEQVLKQISKEADEALGDDEP